MFENTPLFFSAQGSDVKDGAEKEKEMAMLFAKEDVCSKGVWLFCVTVLLACGCETVTVPPQQTGTRYVNANEVIFGKPTAATMYDLETAVQNLMSKMRGSPRFTENYNAAKKAKGSLPIVVLGNIENKTTDRIQGRLDAMRDTIRTSLYDTGLVEVKDDEASEAIRSRIIRGADGGLETSALVQTLGRQDAPDFIVLGDMRHFTDVGGYHTYRLRLAIHSLTTGKVVWEGIQTMVKL